ncbi:MAG TPA: hypothetical protein VNZ64_03420 [Candidatus Acidoferrum sp.]|nr:hypothetical protein [Candidatus Acidoferrum sp.]
MKAQPPMPPRTPTVIQTSLAPSLAADPVHIIAAIAALTLLNTP